MPTRPAQHSGAHLRRALSGHGHAAVRDLVPLCRNCNKHLARRAQPLRRAWAGAGSAPAGAAAPRAAGQGGGSGGALPWPSCVVPANGMHSPALHCTHLVNVPHVARGLPERLHLHRGLEVRRAGDVLAVALLLLRRRQLRLLRLLHNRQSAPHGQAQLCADGGISGQGGGQVHEGAGAAAEGRKERGARAPQQARAATRRPGRAAAATARACL